MKPGLTLWVGAVFAAAAVTSTTAAEDITSRPAGGIFLPEGDVLMALPEFVAQLGVPAGMDLGRLPPIGRQVKPGWSETPCLDMTYVPPQRLMREFEFVEGTLAQALDSFCRRDGRFSWQRRDGAVLIRLQGAAEEELQAVLDRQIDSWAVDKEPLDAALASLRAAVEAKGPEAAGRSWSWALAADARGNTVFPHRLSMSQPVTVKVKDRDSGDTILIFKGQGR